MSASLLRNMPILITQDVHYTPQRQNTMFLRGWYAKSLVLTCENWKTGSAAVPQQLTPQTTC